MSLARVLVVDDERFFREAISEVLRRQGIEPQLASTGEEALEGAADERVGVVILDLQLPDLHGLEVFRHLRECRPELRVIILSAHTDQEYVLEALRLGAFDYLAKPLHEEELALAVARALEAYENAAGWSALRTRLARLGDALAQLGAQAGQGEPAALYDPVVELTGDVLAARRTSLLLLAEDGQSLRIAATRGWKPETGAASAEVLLEGAAGWVAARREALRVVDVAEDERFRGRVPSERYRSRSFLVAPVALGSRLLGVLCATERRPGAPFQEEDLALVRILADQVARCLAEAAASAEGPPRSAAKVPVLQELELTQGICEALAAHAEPGRMLQSALRHVSRVLSAAPVALYLRSSEGDLLQREAEWDGGLRSDRSQLPSGRGLTGTAAASGQLIASPEPASDPRFDPQVDTPEDGAAGPLLCGPLHFRGRVLGVFRVFPERPEQATASLGEALSAALSAAVRTALLYRSLVETIDEVARARKQAARSPALP